MPNFDSDGLPMMPLADSKVPPGLSRQQTVSGRHPRLRSRQSTMSRPSRFTIAPIPWAMRYVSSGVSLEESITRRPLTPHASAITSSVEVAQSQPQPMSARRRSIAGVGVAFTAKYSRKPWFQENASRSARTRDRIVRSS